MSFDSDWIDISPALTSDVAVWPGDTPLSREVKCDLASGDNITLSTLVTTVHVGSHADAPSHYGRNAPTIDMVPISRYLGPCLVLDVRVDGGHRIPAEVLDSSARTERLLLKTGTFSHHEEFSENFAALSSGLVEVFARQGGRLIGIDTPSVDLFHSKELPAHRACLEHDVAILEGLQLDHIVSGAYELVAPPLRLAGFDASPVRALLRPLK